MDIYLLSLFSWLRQAWLSHQFPLCKYACHKILYLKLSNISMCMYVYIHHQSWNIPKKISWSNLKGFFIFSINNQRAYNMTKRKNLNTIFFIIDNQISNILTKKKRIKFEFLHESSFICTCSYWAIESFLFHLVSMVKDFNFLCFTGFPQSNLFELPAGKKKRNQREPINLTARGKTKNLLIDDVFMREMNAITVGNLILP